MEVRHQRLENGHLIGIMPLARCASDSSDQPNDEGKKASQRWIGGGLSGFSEVAADTFFDWAS